MDTLELRLRRRLQPGFLHELTEENAEVELGEWRAENDAAEAAIAASRRRRFESMLESFIEAEGELASDPRTALAAADIGRGISKLGFELSRLPMPPPEAEELTSSGERTAPDALTDSITHQISVRLAPRVPEPGVAWAERWRLRDLGRA
jgi:hypothetical protein